MPRPDFTVLRKNLIEAGLGPRHVHRTISELDDHFDDIVEASLEDGLSLTDAEQRAMQSLGDFNDIARAMDACPDLKSWAWHFPKLALLVYPLACVAALPAAPLIAGAQNAPQLGRWLTCLLLGGLVTASMFLVLQLSITLT